MPVSARDIPIERPCPVDLDPALSDGSRRAWQCGHCDQRVHVLSSMTEAEARTFMVEHDGERICVTYLERADGSIVFRPPAIVPLSALSARRIALGVGLGAALAACTPSESAQPAAAVQVTATQSTMQAPTPVASHSTMSAVVDVHKAQAEAELARVRAEEAVAAAEKAKAEAEEKAREEAMAAVPRPGGIMARPLPPSPPPTAAPMIRRGGRG